MAMNRRLHDFSLAQETMPFGFRNRFIAFAFLCFCGCAFPKEQTRYKAKVLKEQGQNAAAQRLEAQAEYVWRSHGSKIIKRIDEWNLLEFCIEAVSDTKLKQTTSWDRSRGSLFRHGATMPSTYLD